MKRRVLLHPGEHLDGELSLDPAMFNFPHQRLSDRALLTGWNDSGFTDTERTELEKMPGAFLRGEVPASASIDLLAPAR